MITAFGARQPCGRKMSNRTNSQNVQRAQPTTATLANNFEITIAGGMWCGECGDDIRAIDAEALDDQAMRLVCECGDLVLHYRPRR
jgi:hypothetical protein